MGVRPLPPTCGLVIRLISSSLVCSTACLGSLSWNTKGGMGT